MPKRVAFAMAGAAVALTSAVVATTASASGGLSPAHSSATVSTHLSPAQTCYAQLDNDSGIGIVSQTFESTFSVYNSRGADDFQLDAPCTVSSVAVNGTYFNGAGQVDSVHVIFYHSRDSTRVGQVISSQNNLSYSDDSQTGNLTADLHHPFRLEKRTNWVAVKANMAFSSGGEWGWNTNLTARRLNSRWANPGDGFGTGCVTWGDTVTCIPSGEGPDFSFALLK